MRWNCWPVVRSQSLAGSGKHTPRLNHWVHLSVTGKTLAALLPMPCEALRLTPVPPQGIGSVLLQSCALPQYSHNPLARDDLSGLVVALRQGFFRWTMMIRRGCFAGWVGGRGSRAIPKGTWFSLWHTLGCETIFGHSLSCVVRLLCI